MVVNAMLAPGLLTLAQSRASMTSAFGCAGVEKHGLRFDSKAQPYRT